MAETFSDEVARLCYAHFNKLPKKGKPQSNKEWTLLSAILIGFDGNISRLKVVAMSTGTRCLGESQLSQGDVLSDSHAEVLTRRALIRFLYHHMNIVLQQKKSEVLLFDEVTKKFFLRPEVKLHFFVSHVPCGDAAIFPKDSNDLEALVDRGVEPKPKKLKKDDSEASIAESEKFDSNEDIDDIHRTGAKCVKDGLQDPKAPGKDFHIVGVLRTKPGRGIPTLSMSCSDKIAIWNTCGLQGALLSHFFKSPIYVTSFVLGRCPFNQNAVERAIFERLSGIRDMPSSYSIMKPRVMQSSLVFEHSKKNVTGLKDKVVPCHSSIIWSDVPNPLEVSVNGKKQGVTKKNFNKPSSRVCICRQVFFEQFLVIAEKMSQYDDKYKTFRDLTYLQCKQSAEDYQAAKKTVFTIFLGWVRKPDTLQNFYCPLKEK